MHIAHRISAISQLTLYSTQQIETLIVYVLTFNRFVLLAVESGCRRGDGTWDEKRCGWRWCRCCGLNTYSLYLYLKRELKLLVVFKRKIFFKVSAFLHDNGLGNIKQTVHGDTLLPWFQLRVTYTDRKVLADFVVCDWRRCCKAYVT